MNTMKNEKLKDFVLAVVASLFCIFIYHATGKLISGSIADDFLSTFLAESVFSVFVMGAVILLRQTDLFHSDPVFLKSGWSSAGLLFIMLLAFGVFGLSRLLNDGISITPVQWLLMIGHVILVGFCEEVLFRGLIQRALHRLYGEDSLAHVLLAVFCTGLLFGFAHLINMDRGNPTLVVVYQVGVTCFMGMYFSAIYYRTGKNIRYVIFLHALYDFLGMIVNGRASGATLTSVLNPGGGSNSPLGVAIAVLMWGTIYTLTTLFVLRAKKLKPLLSCSN